MADIPLYSEISDLDLIAQTAKRDATLTQHRLVLYAGANYPSRAARDAYVSGFSAYPAMGPSFDKEQPDTDEVSALEQAAEQAVCSLFSADWAELRVQSATLANLTVFHALSRPGDLLLAPAAAHGGHLSQRRGGTPELAGLTVSDLPFDTASCRLDAEATADLIRSRKPRLVMLGRSVILTADDIAPVIEAARAVGSITIYDASHVSGLIAGEAFPNPLAQGVDVMTSSTYKTLRGRPQGLIAGRNAEHGAAVKTLLDTRMLANYDAGKLPSLLTTLLETMQDGRDYAQRVIANTRALAGALGVAGIEVLVAPADRQPTHQLLIPLAQDQAPGIAVRRLAENGILVGTCADPRRAGRYALRVGSQFLTRQGLGESDMRAVAEIIAIAVEQTGDGVMVAAGNPRNFAFAAAIEQLAKTPVI